MKKADEMYQLGIARKAKPLKRLQTRYGEFQKRILGAPAGSSMDADEAMAPPPPAPTARKVLGERTKPAVSADSDPFTVSASSSRPTTNNGARIAVFRDGVDHPGMSIVLALCTNVHTFCL
jgi:checkpoint serine/threonine-protein kinase